MGNGQAKTKLDSPDNVTSLKSQKPDELGAKDDKLTSYNTLFKEVITFGPNGPHVTNSDGAFSTWARRHWLNLRFFLDYWLNDCFVFRVFLLLILGLTFVPFLQLQHKRLRLYLLVAIDFAVNLLLFLLVRKSILRSRKRFDWEHISFNTLRDFNWLTCSDKNRKLLQTGHLVRVPFGAEMPFDVLVLSATFPFFADEKDSPPEAPVTTVFEKLFHMLKNLEANKTVSDLHFSNTNSKLPLEESLSVKPEPDEDSSDQLHSTSERFDIRDMENFRTKIVRHEDFVDKMVRVILSKSKFGLKVEQARQIKISPLTKKSHSGTSYEISSKNAGVKRITLVFSGSQIQEDHKPLHKASYLSLISYLQKSPIEITYFVEQENVFAREESPQEPTPSKVSTPALSQRRGQLIQSENQVCTGVVHFGQMRYKMVFNEAFVLRAGETVTLKDMVGVKLTCRVNSKFESWYRNAFQDFLYRRFFRVWVLGLLVVFSLCLVKHSVDIYQNYQNEVVRALSSGVSVAEVIVDKITSLFPSTLILVFIQLKLCNYLMMRNLHADLSQAKSTRPAKIRNSSSKLRTFFAKFRSFFTSKSDSKNSKDQDFHRNMTKSEFFSEHRGDTGREISGSLVFRSNNTRGEESYDKTDSLKHKIEDQPSDPNTSGLSGRETISSSENGPNPGPKPKPKRAQATTEDKEAEDLLRKATCVSQQESLQDSKMTKEGLWLVEKNPSLVGLLGLDKVVVEADVLEAHSEFKLKFYVTPNRFYSLKDLRSIKKVSKDLLWGANNASNKNKIENARLMFQEKSQENLDEMMGNYDAAIMHEEGIWKQMGNIALEVPFPEFNLENVLRTSKVMMGGLNQSQPPTKSNRVVRVSGNPQEGVRDHLLRSRRKGSLSQHKSYRSPCDFSRPSNSSFKQDKARSSQDLSIQDNTSNYSYIEDKLMSHESENEENLSLFEVNPANKVGVQEFVKDLNFTKHRDQLEENTQLQLILVSAVWVLEGFTEENRPYIRTKLGVPDAKDSLSELDSNKIKTLIPRPFILNSSKSDLYSR